MADTRQIVSWSVEKKCAFRSGEDFFLPDKTNQQLSDLRILARAVNDNRVVDGICVTSWTTASDNSGGYHDIPCNGFRIEDRLGKFGGVESAKSTCGNCEANADSKLETKIAGCFGYLDVWPDSPELEEQLWKIIEAKNLEDRMRNLFPVTTPLWYGLWIISPLQRTHCEFLHELLGEACDPEDPQDDDVVHFLNAIQQAAKWELPVHVSLAPLGHTDFGWYTVFPHCPRCKANAPVGRWKDKYPDGQVECKACGHSFNPDGNRSQERMDDDWEASSLEKLLGSDGQESFTKSFLRHRGCTPELADEVVDNKSNGPLLREIEKVRRKRKATLRQIRSAKVSSESTNLPQHFSVDIGATAKMDFVLIPAGEFQMGSPESVEQPTESPQHLVRIEKPFYIGRFSVTQSQWQALMQDQRFRPANPDLPVDQVSWIEAQQFCQKLCKEHDQIFRLPTEAEWEYSCRAGTKTKFAFGDSLSVDQANFTPFQAMFATPPESEEEFAREMEKLAEGDRESDREKKPTPVGTYPPNNWGVYDMHGNVDEWCEDVWHDSYEGAPTDGSAWLVGEEYQPFRVVRGGWCSGTEFVCASASRRQLRADAGEYKERDTDDDEDGFMSALFDMMYTPYGFRIVHEV